jgi:serine/threonine protein phosphatase PrpC
VAGILAMTRAMGDFTLKRTTAQRCGKVMYDPLLGPVSALPDVQVGAVAPSVCAHVILACDGVWDVIQSAEAVALAALTLSEGGQPAKELVDEAFARGSTDNITSLVLRIPPLFPGLRKSVDL